MARRIEDIAPGRRRSIRDIRKADIMPDVRATRDPRAAELMDEHGNNGLPYRHVPQTRDAIAGTEPEIRHSQRQNDLSQELAPASRSNKWAWIVAVVGVIAVVFSVASLFAGATVYLVPSESVVPLTGTYTAYQNPTQGELGFSTVNVTDTATATIAATVTKQVEDYASGIITISNAYSSASQKLITNTRFEAPNGNIYRIHEPVTVPGSSVKNGQVIPGTIDVRVYADKPGDSYNISSGTFTVPGFKGSPQYTKFGATIKTSITGGIAGTVHTLAQADWQKELDTLHAALDASLFKKAYGQIASTSVMYKGATTVSFNDPTNIPVSKDSSSIDVSLSGTLTGVSFDQAALSVYLAQKNLTNYDSRPVMIKNIDTLDLQPSSTTFDPSGDSFTFDLTGTADEVWQVNTDQVKQALVGMGTDQFRDAMKAFSNVKKGRAEVSPFWVHTFPKNPDRITVKIVSEATLGDSNPATVQ